MLCNLHLGKEEVGILSFQKQTNIFYPFFTLNKFTMENCVILSRGGPTIGNWTCLLYNNKKK